MLIFYVLDDPSLTWEHDIRQLSSPANAISNVGQNAFARHCNDSVACARFFLVNLYATCGEVAKKSKSKMKIKSKKMSKSKIKSKIRIDAGMSSRLWS